MQIITKTTRASQTRALHKDISGLEGGMDTVTKIDTDETRTRGLEGKAIHSARLRFTETDVQPGFTTHYADLHIQEYSKS